MASNCSQDIDMRILSTQHSTTTLPIEEENSAKSPTLTITTIASPDHQPSHCQVDVNAVTALLPPVPPLTSSPVMSMLSNAHNRNNTTKKSMFGDLGASDTTSSAEMSSGIVDYSGFLNKPQTESQSQLDYSQYLKDSNIDLEKTNLEDLNGKLDFVGYKMLANNF